MRKVVFILALALATITSCGNTGKKQPKSASSTVTEAPAKANPAARPAPKPKNFVAEVVREFPHDESSYTQGLFFHEGQLYESTGLYGESTLRIVDLRSGKALRKMDFDRKYFAEGSVILGGSLYVLTWESRLAFKYDAQTLEYQASYNYPREGWGLTTDGTRLIASDGSSNLFFLDENFKTLKTVKVRMGNRPVADLNELEYIDGKVWANIYLTGMVVIIDPETGYVEATVDCGALKPSSKAVDADVLNGIAWDGENIYMTGKKWDKLFQVRLK